MAFPLQQWLQKRTSMFRCKYVTKTFKFNGEGILNVRVLFYFSLELSSRTFFASEQKYYGNVLRVWAQITKYVKVRHLSCLCLNLCHFFY